MTIQKARKLLGDQAKNLTDEQIMDFIKNSKVIVDALFESIIKMTPEERKKFKKEM